MRPVMWMFVAVLVTFVVTRLITRRIRTKRRNNTVGGLLRDISVGGVHIHHQVFGIALMTLIGLVMFAAGPTGAGLSACAAAFGVGVSLAFDEFALWLHLDDVYWTPAGRQSVDAIFCVLMITGAMVGGVDFVTGEIGSDEWWFSVVVLLIALVVAVICLLKGKVVTGVVGVLLVLPALVGAARLAKPDSWWARRFYAGQKSRRSERRFDEAYRARWNHVRDFIGGRPDDPVD